MTPAHSPTLRRVDDNQEGGNGDDDGDDLYSYFNRSVSAVQAHADQFEQAYARPALRTSQAFFDEHPLVATFVAIFSLLSFLPVVSFIGFSLFTIASATIVALCCAFLVSITIVLTLLSFLVLTLLTTFISSAFLTLSGITIYSLIRLSSLVRVQGRPGVSAWLAEMQNAMMSTLPIQLYSPKSQGALELSDMEDILNGLSAEVKREVSDGAPLFGEPVQEHLCSGDDVKVSD